MTDATHISRGQLIVAGVLLASAIFVADLRLPLGIAGGVPYVAVVLLALWSPRESDVLIASGATVGLTMLGWSLSPIALGDTPAWTIAVNRALAIFAIAVTGGGSFLWQRSRAEIAAVREELFESERRRDEAEALARLGKMSSLIAHEIKNPLAGMRAALQVLSRGMAEESSERHIMTEICARVDALHTTLENMLVYGRPDAARPEPLLIRDIIATAAAQLRQDPAHGGVVIDVALADDVYVLVDPRKTTAAVFNLLLNAAQAMDDDGTILVRMTTAKETCILEIVDDGPGIDPRLQATIFDPFVTTKARGTGLGLAIVRQTVTQHGGSISLRSALGAGTCVTLTLPTTTAAPTTTVGPTTTTLASAATPSQA